jgi:hypothetical protein
MMFRKTTIITGFVSGIMLMTAAFTSPVKAAENPLGVGLAIIDLLLKGDAEPQNVQARSEYWPRDYYDDNYKRLPVRRITEKMKRHGLYPVSEFRMRRGRIIVRAENDRGVLFRVVISAQSGNVIKSRRIDRSRRWQPAPTYDWDNYRRPAYDWDDYRRPTYDDSWSDQRRHYRKNRLDRKIKKNRRAHRREERKRVIRRKRKQQQAHVKKRKYIDAPRVETRQGGSKARQLSEEYKMWKYGSGK